MTEPLSTKQTELIINNVFTGRQNELIQRLDLIKQQLIRDTTLRTESEFLEVVRKEYNKAIIHHLQQNL